MILCCYTVKCGCTAEEEDIRIKVISLNMIYLTADERERAPTSTSAGKAINPTSANSKLRFLPLTGKSAERLSPSTARRSPASSCNCSTITPLTHHWGRGAPTDSGHRGIKESSDAAAAATHSSSVHLSVCDYNAPETEEAILRDKHRLVVGAVQLLFHVIHSSTILLLLYINSEAGETSLRDWNVSVADLDKKNRLIDMRSSTWVAMTRSPSMDDGSLHSLLRNPSIPTGFTSVQTPLLVRPVNVNWATEIDVVKHLGSVCDLNKRHIHQELHHNRHHHIMYSWLSHHAWLLMTSRMASI